MTERERIARLEFAKTIASEAGEITLRYFNRNNFSVERKDDDSPVTVADRSAEQHLRQRIRERFPEDGILGEEFGETAGASGYRWVLDPIDGTKSFIHGVPLYGTLIGIECDHRSVIGLIRVPALQECVYAASGLGAWFTIGEAEPRRATVGTCQELASALFCTSEVEGFHKVNRPDVFARISQQAGLVRTWGDCYGYLLVATGRADLMVDPRMHPWDAAALPPILEEAGGQFTDWRGQRWAYGGNGVATNPQLLEKVLAITANAPPM